MALVFLAFVGAYLLTAVAPGDPLAEGLRSRERTEATRERLGLNDPIPIRLATRLSRLAVLDFGTSLRYDRPVLTLVTERTASTVQAGVLALLFALAIGIPAGVAGSRARWPLLRNAIRIVSIGLLSMPALVVALMLAVLVSGTGVPALAVMVIALALPAAAIIERLQARAMDAVQDDICLDAARARGIPEARITWRHAWPLSLSSVLGVVGVLAGHLLSGALAIELVTARSGLGSLTYDALMARDFDLAAGCAAAAALLVSLATLAADVTQMWIDPRSTA